MGLYRVAEFQSRIFFLVKIVIEIVWEKNKTISISEFKSLFLDRYYCSL